MPLRSNFIVLFSRLGFLVLKDVQKIIFMPFKKISILKAFLIGGWLYASFPFIFMSNPL